MIKVTQDLKATLQKNKHIEKVYFDKIGNHYFNAQLFKHPKNSSHKDNGKIFHRIKDLTGSKTSTNEQGVSNSTKVYIYEADPDHELVDTLSAIEVLRTPIADTPNFDDATHKEIFEKQAQEYAKVKAELDELKAGSTNDDIMAELEKMKDQLAEMETVKAELEKAKADNEVYQEMIAESQSKTADVSNEADPGTTNTVTE